MVTAGFPVAEVGAIRVRSEGSVKNYFHSRMRVAMRRINRWARTMQGSVKKGIKATVLAKLLQCGEDYFLQDDREAPTQARECFCKKVCIQYSRIEFWSLYQSEKTKMRPPLNNSRTRWPVWSET